MLLLRGWQFHFFGVFFCLTVSLANGQNGIVVFQTDFGLKDGAVAEMKGVCMSVSDKLKLFDITHEIPPFNIWDAAYRLQQTLPYWPVGTVFISVVDPGVGSERKSVVAKTKSGHFIVTPDNGTLTLVNDLIGIEAIRQIDESKNRLSGSSDSYTFYGRDVYAYTGAGLAIKAISFEEVGALLNAATITRLHYEPPTYKDGIFSGNIPVLDVQYGNIWTNISYKLLLKNGIKYGDSLAVKLYNGKKLVFNKVVLFGNTFSAVASEKPVAYINSLLNFSLALNMASFAQKYHIQSGANWHILIEKNKTSGSKN